MLLTCGFGPHRWAFHASAVIHQLSDASGGIRRKQVVHINKRTSEMRLQPRS